MRFKNSAMTWFAILFLVTCVLALVAPPSPHTLQAFHISGVVYHLLVLSLLLPYGLIWFAAFYGYDQLQQYAKTIATTTEGRATQKIASGLRVLAWGFILTTILGLVLGYIRDAMPGFAAAQTIIYNYALIIVAIVAMTFIGDGTNVLLTFVNSVRSKASVRWLILISSVVGVLFARYVVHNSNMNDNPYYLPMYPLLLTIVVPYLYAWIVGLIATMDLRIYSKRVKGIIYRGALQKVANGLTIVIVVSVTAQFITAAFTRGQSMSLGSALLFDYLLLALEALGYILIAVGAKRLKMIEEV